MSHSDNESIFLDLVLALVHIVSKVIASSALTSTWPIYFDELLPLIKQFINILMLLNGFWFLAGII